MSVVCKVLLWAVMVTFLTAGAKAQLYFGQEGKAHLPPQVSVCHEMQDIYDVALGIKDETDGDIWLKKVAEGKCLSYHSEYQYVTTLSTVGENVRVVKLLVPFRGTDYVVYAILEGELVKEGVWSIRDLGQWDGNDPTVRKWYQQLMQPDNPQVSCCGEADAFEADEFVTDGVNYIVTITNGRGMMPTGKTYIVPQSKIKWDNGNPTGHGILFLSTTGDIYCYVMPALG